MPLYRFALLKRKHVADENAGSTPARGFRATKGLRVSWRKTRVILPMMRRTKARLKIRCESIRMSLLMCR